MEESKYEECRKLKNIIEPLELKVATLTDIIESDKYEYYDARIQSAMGGSDVTFRLPREDFIVILEMLREKALKRLSELDEEFKNL